MPNKKTIAQRKLLNGKLPNGKCPACGRAGVRACERVASSATALPASLCDCPFSLCDCPASLSLCNCPACLSLRLHFFIFYMPTAHSRDRSQGATSNMHTRGTPRRITSLLFNSDTEVSRKSFQADHSADVIKCTSIFQPLSFPSPPSFSLHCKIYVDLSTCIYVDICRYVRCRFGSGHGVEARNYILYYMFILVEWHETIQRTSEWE